MLAFRIIAVVALILLVVVIGSFFWTLGAPAVGHLDAVAARRIQQECGFQAECKVRLGEVFEGDWDTFYEFGRSVPQAEMDQAQGAHRVLARPGQRLLVLLKNHRIVTAQYAKDGADTPLEGEVEFESERHRDQRLVMYPRATLMRVTRFPRDPADKRLGTYLVLSADAPTE